MLCAVRGPNFFRRPLEFRCEIRPVLAVASSRQQTWRGQRQRWPCCCWQWRPRRRSPSSLQDTVSAVWIAYRRGHGLAASASQLCCPPPPGVRPVAAAARAGCPASCYTRTNCHCASNGIPGGLAASVTPQFIMVRAAAWAARPAPRGASGWCCSPRRQRGRRGPAAAARQTACKPARCTDHQ